MAEGAWLVCYDPCPGEVSLTEGDWTELYQSSVRSYIPKWRESRASDRGKKELRNPRKTYTSVSPERTFQKPKCRLIESLCDLLTVRDTQMFVTTRTASKLNEFFSLVQWRTFVLLLMCNSFPGLKYVLHKLKITVAADERLKCFVNFLFGWLCPIIYRGLIQIFSPCIRFN